MSSAITDAFVSSATDYVSSTTVPEVQLGSAHLHVADIVVIVAYFVIIMVVGIWSSRKSSSDTVSGYFLASRSMHWIPVGASLFASNIGSGHFIGLAGSGAAGGIAVAGFEISAIFTLMILGWIFVPVYTAAGVNTMPEYLKLRYGGQRIRIYLSLLSLILYIFTKISADLFAGAIFIKQSLNLNMYISVCILLSIAALFTIAGGLTAVMWTDFVQTVLMLAGATFLSVLSLSEVGGYTSLLNSFALRAEPTDPKYELYRDNCTPSANVSCISCSAVTKYYRNILRPPTDEDLPATGLIFGLLVVSIWYWCTDQVIVQRALSAKSVSHAKSGCILASYCKILPLYLLVLPGMAARVLWPNEIGCSNPVECKRICGSESGCSNIAYPLLVLRIMPKGATGLMLSVMMAALMSSLTSIFNSASTIFTIDIWTRIRKHSTEIEQVIVGRVFVLVLVVISVIWIPIIEASQGSKLFDYIQSVQSYLAPPVCAIFLLGLLWPRINEKGAFWGLMCGLVIGLIRFIMEFSYKAPPCGSGLPDPRPAILSKVHYLHFGMILFIIVCAVTIVVSLMTKPIDEIHLYRLTLQTKFSDKVRVDIDTKKQQTNTDLGIPNIAFRFDSEDGLQMDSKANKGDVVSKEVEVAKTTTSKHKHRNLSKYLYAMCCMSSQNQANNYDVNSGDGSEKTAKISKEEEAKNAADSAKETPFWQNTNNAGAIIIIAIGAFLFGFYA